MKWSHSLLSDEEQRLFRYLGVFPGDFALEHVSRIFKGIDEDELDDLLESLTDRYLVSLDDHRDIPTYHLQDTIRAYALEKLSESGEMEEIKQRHSEVKLK